MSHQIDTETIETPAGEYVIAWHVDDYVDQPYDEGFTLAVNGKPDRHIDIDEGDADSTVWSVLRNWRDGYTGYPEIRSGAALVRWLTLTGKKGVTLVNQDYQSVDATADRFERVHGVAWAPDDVPDEHDGDKNYPATYVKNNLAVWRAWAEGDTFGYTVTDPQGNTIDSCGGYYGFDSERDYTRSEAISAIDADVAERIEKSNLVGAGFVGLI